MTEEEERRAQEAYRRIVFELMPLLEAEGRSRAYARVAAQIIREYPEDSFPPPPKLRMMMAAELLPWMEARGGVS